MKSFSQAEARGRGRGGAVFLLFLAVAIFLGSLGYYLYSKREDSDSVEVICVFLVSGVDREDWARYGAEWISVGEPLRSENGTVILGRVEIVAEVESLRAVVRNGEAAWETNPYLTDLEIAVRAQVSLRAGDGARAGDLRMAAGARGRFRFGEFLTAAELVEIREVDR